MREKLKGDHNRFPITKSMRLNEELLEKLEYISQERGKVKKMSVLAKIRELISREYKRIKRAEK